MTWKIFVNGKSIESSSNELIDVINPANEEIIAKTPSCSEEDVNTAVESASKAFKSWKNTTPAQRSRYLLDLAQLIKEHKQELARLEAENTGKSVVNAEGEVEGIADTLEFFAGAARTLGGSNSGEYAEGRTSMIRREPIGVVGSITPWNYPLMMAGWKIGPALAAGNTVVLKPSELTPLTSLKLAEIANNVLPPGVLNVITGHGDSVGTAMTRHPDIHMISLTGSVRAGKNVAKNASDTLKKVHLELGGKAPVIVFEDADVSKVVKGVISGAFYNSGQDCTAATRLYVSEKIYDEVIQELVEEIKNIKVGDLSEIQSGMGPLISKEHLDRVAGFVERAKSKNHIQVLAGGSIVERAGFYYEPTLLSGAEQTDEIMQQEVFGPVLVVSKFKEEEQFVDLANDCQYALAASVWTENASRAMNLIKELKFGTVWVNDHLSLVSEMPHGGYKLSGYGNDQSVYSLEEYTEIKHAMIKFEE